MALLKNSVITNVIQTLDCSEFCSDDFKLSFPDNGSTLLSIVFMAKENYYFHVKEDTKAITSIANHSMLALGGHSTKEYINVFKCHISPGEYKNTEIVSHDELDNAISYIHTWTKHIREELVSARYANNTDPDDFLQEMHQSIDDTITSPDEYFSRSEAELLHQKLAALQARLSELESKYNLTSADKIKLEATIEKTKSDISAFPKGIWYKTAVSKITKTIKEVLKTSEGRQALYDVTKKLIDSL